MLVQAPSLSCCKRSSKSEALSLEVVRGGSRWWRNLPGRAIHGTYTRLNEPPRLVNIATTGGHSSQTPPHSESFTRIADRLHPLATINSQATIHFIDFKHLAPPAYGSALGFFKTESSAPYIFSDFIFAHHLEDQPAVLQVKTFEIISGDRRLVSLYLCFQFVPR